VRLPDGDDPVAELRGRRAFAAADVALCGAVSAPRAPANVVASGRVAIAAAACSAVGATAAMTGGTAPLSAAAA